MKEEYTKQKYSLKEHSENFINSCYNLFREKIEQIDVNYLVITLVALSQGITGLSDLAISYLYKDDLKLEPSQVSRINSIATIPWIVKPIYGFISDSFPIFQYRRKPYLFIFGVTVTLCWVLMSFWVDSVYKAITIILINQTATAFCNVIGEALVVETSQKQKEIDPDAGAKNVSMYFLIKSFGSLLTAFSSGALLEYMDKRNVFLITACFPIMIVVSAILLKEKKVSSGVHNPIQSGIIIESFYSTISSDNSGREMPHTDLRTQLSLFWSFLKMDEIYKPIIFIFLFMSTPSYGDPLFYFYTNVLNFPPMVMGRLRLIYGIASVSGIIIYNKYLKRVGFKKIICTTTFLSMLFNMFTIMLVTRFNIQLGIPDFWFCMTADALTTALAEINSMPLLVLACNICPKNIEGTLYAFIMSAINLGSLFSNQFGALLTNALNITDKNFTNLKWLVFIANIIYLLPMPSLYLINENSYHIKKEVSEHILKESLNCSASTNTIYKMENLGEFNSAKLLIEKNKIECGIGYLTYDDSICSLEETKNSLSDFSLKSKKSEKN